MLRYWAIILSWCFTVCVLAKPSPAPSPGFALVGYVTWDFWPSHRVSWTEWECFLAVMEEGEVDAACVLILCVLLFNCSAVLLSKYRLKSAVTIHFLLVVLMAFRLSVALYVIAGYRPPRSLQKLRLPAAKNWEIIWLLGNVITCLVGIISLLRNRPTLVRLYAAGPWIETEIYTSNSVVALGYWEFWKALRLLNSLNENLRDYTFLSFDLK